MAWSGEPRGAASRRQEGARAICRGAIAPSGAAGQGSAPPGSGGGVLIALFAVRQCSEPPASEATGKGRWSLRRNVGRSLRGVRRAARARSALVSSPYEGAPAGVTGPMRGGARKKDDKGKEGDKQSDWRKALSKQLRNMAAGAIAGSAVESALYPIDTIKTRLQAMKGAASAKQKIAVLRGIGGVKGMYAGLLGNLAGVIPSSALFFSVYEPVKEKLLDPSSGVQPWVAHVVAATSGAVSASFIRVPTEVVKSRMQMGQFSSPVVAVRSIIGAEGVAGCYAGFRSFLLRDISFDVIEFVSYEQIRSFYLARKAPGEKLTAVEGSAIGAMAGALTGTLTTPLDVIKTRMMLQGKEKVYKGVVDCTMKMVAQEGFGSLFKGVGPRVTWISIGGAVFFGALEQAKMLLAALEKP